MVEQLNGSARLANLTNPATDNPYGCILLSNSHQIARFVILAGIMIWAIIGNAFVVAVFYKTRTLRTTVYCFIVNMSISDLLVPIAYLPPMISAVVNGDNRWLLGGVLGSGFCKITHFAWPVSTFVSIFSTMAIAVDRFQAILYPMRPSFISPKRCRCIIAVIWVVSATFRAHVLYAYRLVSHGTKIYCVFQWEPASYTSKALLITLSSLMCVSSISALVLTVLYSSIVVSLYKQKNRLHLGSEAVRKRAKRNQRITCMLVIIVIVFYVAWSPFNVKSVLYLVKPAGVIQCDIVAFGVQVIYPAINPVIYYIFNSSYRQGLRNLLCCHVICQNKCNNCFKSSVAAQNEHNSVEDAGQVNDAVGTNGIQGQR